MPHNTGVCKVNSPKCECIEFVFTSTTGYSKRQKGGGGGNIRWKNWWVHRKWKNQMCVDFPKINQLTTIRWHCTQATHSWQRMLQRLQRNHQGQQHDIPTRATSWSLEKQGGEGNPNVQRPLSGNSMWSRHLVSAKPVGPTITPSRAHPQHVGISLHIPLGATWLQRKPLCSPGIQSWIAFGTQHPRDMGTTFGKRVLRWNILGTLPLSRSIHQRHQTHTHVQFGILQAQISHEAILNDSGCPHPSSRQSHNCTGRSYPTAQHDHRRHCATHQYLQDASRERERRRNSSKGAQREGTSWKGAHRDYHHRQSRPASPLFPVGRWVPVRQLAYH